MIDTNGRQVSYYEFAAIVDDVSQTELDFSPELPVPTSELRGSPGKVAVMRARFERGQALFHPDDAIGGVVRKGPSVTGPDGRLPRTRVLGSRKHLGDD